MDFLIPNSHKKFILKFDTSKLLNINDITKRIGNFFIRQKSDAIN